MSLTIHSKYKYFDSTVQKAEDRRQKFHFCRLPFAVNVMLNLSHKRRIHVYALRIGLLQQAITWYKIRHAGGQAHYYSHTGTLKQRDLNKFDWPLFQCPSMADFVPCDHLLQKAYSQCKECIIISSES